jgi:S-adenosylmethionine hydrolase
MPHLQGVAALNFMRPSGIITLTTDFGYTDAYVAAMKGVILSINPNAKIVDVTHEVQPSQIEQGAFLLGSALPYFPSGTVHVAVVDPGVGTDRQALALVTGDSVLVGPDNGLLAIALSDELREAEGETVPLPDGYRAIRLSSEAFFRQPVSNTFHGRDIFAPVAAYLSLGVDVSRLGEDVGAIRSLRPLRAVAMSDGSLHGKVIHIDRFGNLVTDVKGDGLPSDALIDIAGRTIRGLARTYGDADGLMALIGSAGYLEVAVRDSSSAVVMNAMIGTGVTVRIP